MTTQNIDEKIEEILNRIICMVENEIKSLTRNEIIELLRNKQNGKNNNI